MAMTIDFVIPWVDGADPAWQAEKARYMGVVDGNSDASVMRYRDWNELRYWFRGVERFAPWVHRVYFITNGQKPAWLNTAHEKLVWVRHEDYIPKEYLPTFSVNPIELNMHRIEGLSEHFVYFNDDTFLTAPVGQEDFFKNGLPSGLAVESPVTADTDDIFHHILLNNSAFLNSYASRKRFLREQRSKRLSLVDPDALMKNLVMSTLRRDAFFGFAYFHLPSCFLKSTLEKVWEIGAEKLDRTSRTRFRSINDVNQYVFLEYQYVNGLYTPYSYRKNGCAFQVDDTQPGYVEDVCSTIASGRYKMLCVNEFRIEHFEQTRDRINAAFERLLPKRSAFELPES